MAKRKVHEYLWQRRNVQVSYLDVHVYDASRVQVAERLQSLTQNFLRTFFAEATFVLDITIQLAPLSTENKENIPYSLE